MAFFCISSSFSLSCHFSLSWLALAAASWAALIVASNFMKYSHIFINNQIINYVFSFALTSILADSSTPIFTLLKIFNFPLSEAKACLSWASHSNCLSSSFVHASLIDCNLSRSHLVCSTKISLSLRSACSFDFKISPLSLKQAFCLWNSFINSVVSDSSFWTVNNSFCFSSTNASFCFSSNSFKSTE